MNIVEYENIDKITRPVVHLQREEKICWLRSSQQTFSRCFPTESTWLAHISRLL